MKSSRGFTVIELLIVVGVLALGSTVFFIQKQNIETAHRDDLRRTSINALYYSLEEVYEKENGSYPRTVSAETLPSVDPELFNDPNGNEIGLGESDFRYEPTDCDGDDCTGYTLRTTLEQEDDYIKTNRKEK
jgi:prepilin-type N-terminal cleavage/methylation domain-containing protein